MKVLSKTKQVFFFVLIAALAFPVMATATNDAFARPARSGGEKAKNKRIQLSPQTIPARSVPVLREYLPQYIDIHQAEFLNPEDAFIPVPANFDPTSPFINPDFRFKLVRTIGAWLGTRYRYGGRSQRGVDCSGFTSSVISAVLDKKFIGTSRVQAASFTPIFDTDSLQFGDMIFFAGTRKRSKTIGHVGIYVGNGVFAHSSTGKGVIYTHLTDGYYTRRFRWGGRFLSDNPPVRDISHYRYVQ